MSPHAPTCPHELRPGTSVCLHCRRDERIRARARNQRLAIRYGGAGTALAAVAVLVIAGIGAAQGDGAAEPSPLPPPASTFSAPPQAPQAPQAPLVAQVSTATADSSDADATPAESGARVPIARSISAPMPASPAASAPPPAGRPPLAPVIAVGRTELREGMHAERAGDTVRVHFDTELGRTRRAEKFENVVRATLPAVFGAEARTLLARTPTGDIARAGDLLRELPTAGVRLALSDGWTLTLHPETRPGRDGPLVVAYRANVSR